MGQTALEEQKTETRDDGKQRDGAAVVDKPIVDKDVGKALRSVYASTVGEAIPADLLDLLGKLN